MRIVFFSSSELGYTCCEQIINQGHNVIAIYTIPQQFKISYSPNKPVTNVLYKSFDELGHKYNIPVYTIHNKITDHSEELKALNPDLFLVIGWYHMIPSSIRKIAKEGCLGIHGSLLPKYRGGAPLVWSVINGEKQTGASLFYFEDGVDNGDIVDQVTFDINENENISHLLKKLEDACLTLLRKNIPLLIEKRAPRIKQDESKATLFPQRKPEDGLIDWSWDNVRIKNFIRAQTKPYPGAFTMINGKKVIVWDADIIEN